LSPGPYLETVLPTLFLKVCKFDQSRHYAQVVSSPCENSFTVVWSVGCASIVEGAAFLTQQRPTPDRFEELTWELAQQGRALSGPAYLGAVNILQRIARKIARFFASYDIWLTPTLREPPLPLDSFDAPPGNPMYGLQRAVAFVPFTPVCNVTGQLAMSVPLFSNAEGLPVGHALCGVIR
jgi:amidase